MKCVISLIIMVCVSSFLFVADSYAQRGMGRRGVWGGGPGSPCCPLYNIENTEMIKGEVVSVDKIIRGKGISYGVHLMVKTDDKESLIIHLGPGWFIENQDTKIEPKDMVEIKGSRIFFDSKSAIIAYEVKKGKEILVLRDENGYPVWSGWRRGTVVQSPVKEAMKWKGSGRWGPESDYVRMYNSETVETITGKVISVDRITPGKGMSYGIHLKVKTDDETMSVHLGPGWYIENQSINIEPEDTVEIKGSRITFDGKSAIIAAEVYKEDEILRLRDENGFPVWSGWRRR